MANRPRYVLDTNVIVSALLFPDSTPGRSFFEARRRGDILLSDEVVKEITNVLRRPKFDRYVLPEERGRFVANLVRASKLVKPTENIQACRDPNDDKWLELAVEGAAISIITGDADLLSLATFRAIPILTPAQFFQSLAG